VVKAAEDLGRVDSPRFHVDLDTGPGMEHHVGDDTRGV
jgi:hypothetical protein